MNISRFLKNPLITGTLLMTASGIASRIIGFFYRIFLAQTIGAEALGIYQLIAPVFAMCFALTASSIQTSISKFVGDACGKNAGTSQGEITARGYLLLGLVISCTASVIVGIFLYTQADWIALHFLGELRCAPLLSLLSFSMLPCCIHACINGYYYGKKRAGIPSFCQLVEQLARVGSVWLIYQYTLEKGMELKLKELKPEQHFTQPPAHYTEASLVKALEEQGIGRPSTYAPTISTIIARHYVIKENKNLYISELGNAVNNIMMTAFPTIVDVKFTANMESLLDGVAEGTVEWKEIIRNFYPDLKVAIDEAEKELEHVKIEDEVTDVICDKCGRNMVIKYGPHGKFLGCPGFPECHNTKPYLEKIGVACPKCGKDVILKKTKKGRMFYGCEGYPECDFVSWQKPSDKKCPKCGGYMIEKGSKLVCADETCGYVESKNDKEQ